MPTPMPYADVITGAVSVITTLGLWGFVVAGLMIAMGAYLLRRVGLKTR